MRCWVFYQLFQGLSAVEYSTEVNFGSQTVLVIMG
jgi:hypothetical protein